MPEIGATLREARMRARIDISEVEQATKIRAKYLRALENEEWQLLPGSTFVKSFLREYAQYLGLDARLLVEEYKLRYERPSEQELSPISPNLGRRDRRGGPRAPRGGPPRWVVTGGVVLALLALLWLIGSAGGGGEKSASKRTTTAQAHAAPRGRPAKPHTHPSPAASAVTLRIAATGPLYVCLVDERGKVLIPGSTLATGQQTRTYRARKLRLTLGNNQVRLQVNGRTLPVRASSTAIAYELTPRGARSLPPSAGPTCT